MLNEDEVAIYFSKLPHDLNLKVNDNLYSVNKESSAILSGKIRSLVQQNPDSSEITINFDDSKNIFYLVVNFLQGNQIEITPKNAYDLKIAAEELEIPSLQNALKSELESEITINNIIPRVIHNLANPDYLFDHIEEVKNDDQLFDLPIQLLIEIAKSPKSKFESISNKCLFSLSCAVKFPDHFSDFISEEEILNISIDSFCSFIHDEKYKAIEDKLPILKIALHFISSISQIKTKINETVNSISTKNEDIKNIQNENQSLSQEIDKIKLKLEIYQNEIKQLKQRVSQFNIEDLSNIVLSLKDKKADDDILNQYGTKLNQIDQINQKDSYYIRKMGNQTIFIYHDTRAQAMKWLDTLNKQLADVHKACAILPKNDIILEQFVSKLMAIIKQMQLLLCDYF